MSRKILVVDDNVDAAQSLAMVLELLNYEVLIAHDGQQAVFAAKAFCPDLVILDINMPVMDGYAAARAIRNSSGLQRVVLVALTAYGSVSDKQKATEAGFDLHMTKPAAVDLLTKQIHDALEARG